MIKVQNDLFKNKPEEAVVGVLEETLPNEEAVPKNMLFKGLTV